MTRRGFVGYGCLSFGAWVLTSTGANLMTAPRQRAAAVPVLAEGTTLESTVVRGSGRGYTRLAEGPPRATVLRTDLVEPGTRRGPGRTDLATIVQLTDLHITDVQHPLRFEYLDVLCRTGYRPQDLLGTQGATALVRRVNALRGGPFTGRPVDIVVSTGDNTDNQSGLEMQWLLTLLAGGSVWPSSGDAGAFEGAAACGRLEYWHPDGPRLDRYRRYGFPSVPGLLSAATAPFASPGLDKPWLLTMGNHDNTALGTLPLQPELVEWCLGDRKVFSARTDEALVLGARLAAATPDAGPHLDSGGAAALLATLARHGDTRPVTADARREPFTAAQYVAALRDPRYAGAGPEGHGYAADGDPSRLYFSHRLTDRVVLLSLDTTNQAGGAEGSLGTCQLAWLAGRLAEHRDDYVVVLSHHPSRSMQNLAPDPRAPLEPRHSAEQLLTLLHRHPQVVAWVNGHAHRNRITPHRHPERGAGFWEISTASHVDAPQQARVIELARHGDGTLSLFTTLVDALAPVRVPYDDLTPRGLASLYRELAFNDLPDLGRAGALDDGNTQLLLADPFG